MTLLTKASHLPWERGAKFELLDWLNKNHFCLFSRCPSFWNQPYFYPTHSLLESPSYVFTAPAPTTTTKHPRLYRPHSFINQFSSRNRTRSGLEKAVSMPFQQQFWCCRQSISQLGLNAFLWWKTIDNINYGSLLSWHSAIHMFIFWISPSAHHIYGFLHFSKIIFCIYY